MTELRVIVELLPQQWQQSLPTDYSLHFGQITKALGKINARLAHIEQHPALDMTPAIHQQIICDSGRVVMSDAVGRLDQAIQCVERASRTSPIIGERRRVSPRAGTPCALAADDLRPVKFRGVRSDS